MPDGEVAIGGGMRASERVPVGPIWVPSGPHAVRRIGIMMMECRSDGPGQDETIQGGRRANETDPVPLTALGE